MSKSALEIRLALLLWVPCLVLVLGCAQVPVAPKKPPLRVGINPLYPPIAFKLDKKLRGVEVDLARLLGQKLGREVQFFEVRWQRLIPTLVAGNVDIIMSGMTITKTRKFQINFTEPYLETGQMAVMRIRDAGSYRTRKSILGTNANVGVVRGTTGDVFTKKNIPNARVIRLAKVEHTPPEFKRQSIDLFVFDAPAILWLVSSNEGQLRHFPEYFTKEALGWGIRRDDTNFRDTVNRILLGWKQDGTLERVLDRWLPKRPR